MISICAWKGSYGIRRRPDAKSFTQTARCCTRPKKAGHKCQTPSPRAKKSIYHITPSVWLSIENIKSVLSTMLLKDQSRTPTLTLKRAFSRLDFGEMPHQAGHLKYKIEAVALQSSCSLASNFPSVLDILALPLKLIKDFKAVFSISIFLSCGHGSIFSSS